MNKIELVRDDEVLYRSVRGQYGEEYSYEDRKLNISSEAFRDRERKPSVDRAELKEFNPSLSKRSYTDGIVILITEDVRSIGSVKTKTNNGDAVIHAVDVTYDPTPDNPAHSKIVVNPEYFGSKNNKEMYSNCYNLHLRNLLKKMDGLLNQVHYRTLLTETDVYFS